MDDLQGRRIWGWRAETTNLHKLPELSIFDPVHCFSMIALSARRPPCRRAFFSPMATFAKGQARGNGDGRHRRRLLGGAARALARRGGGGGALFVVPLKAEGAFARAAGAPSPSLPSPSIPLLLMAFRHKKGTARRFHPGGREKTIICATLL